MAKTAAEKLADLQDELDEANDRVEELEDYIRDGATLLDEDAADDADGE